MFNGVYKNKRVLVTGHTGFKGSWLSEWLLRLGADLSGVALPPHTNPAMFSLLGLARRMRHIECDVRDCDSLLAAFRRSEPEMVFHLAAQPLVRRSYEAPKETWDVNLGGTLNVLECVRICPSVRACVVVTTDKCYENKEWTWGYRESDPMGGHDPYSASKGACELLVSSHRRSFFQDGHVRLASARAGNTIGGGDWSPDRIVVDFVRAIAKGKPLMLRNPGATRPWQHVLDAVSGYLWLGARLMMDEGDKFAEAWNFGPSDDSVITVRELAHALMRAWGAGEIIGEVNAGYSHEASLLKLDCSKVRFRLGWRGVWDVSRVVNRLVEWYKPVLQDHTVAGELTIRQIESYVNDACKAGAVWTGHPVVERRPA